MQTSNESNISNSQDLQKSSLQSEGELIEQYFSQFQKACISGDLDSVKEVIATSIMPLDYYTIGLHTAASNNHSKLVRYLVEHGGADIENINKVWIIRIIMKHLPSTIILYLLIERTISVRLCCYKLLLLCRNDFDRAWSEC